MKPKDRTVRVSLGEICTERVVKKSVQTTLSRRFGLGAIRAPGIHSVTMGNRKLRRTATNKPKSRKAHTFSLEWNSRDFLLARTWMWLDTCGVGEGRKTKEEPVTMAMKSPLQLGKARRTLMAAWISRTFFLAKTCMWLDTSIKKEKRKNKKVQNRLHISLFKYTWGR